MNNILDKLNKFIKKNVIYTLIISSILSFFVGGALNNALTAWAMQQYGIFNTIVIIIILVFFFLMAIIISVIAISHVEGKNRKSVLEANPISEPLGKKYKGLVASISLLNEPKDRIKEIIDSNDLTEIYKIRGIGQTLRAVKHHIGELKVCWLLCTGDVKDSLEMVEYFIKTDSKKTVKVVKIEIIDSYHIEEISKKIKSVYLEGVKKYGLNETDVIADLTGGTSIMSCAMVLACLPVRRDMEYVLQKSYDLIEIKENVLEIAYDK